MDWIISLMWFGVVVLTVILETMNGQLISIWFMLGSIAALIASFFDVPFIWQLVIFIVLSIVSLIISRPFVKKFVKLKIEDTNLGRCLGKTGIVTEEIGGIEFKGQVKVLGNVWTAVSLDNVKIPVGSEVTVLKIDGVKLIVEPVKKTVSVACK